MTDAAGETYHVSHQAIRLDGQDRALLIVREMTAALRRQEVETWKRVIRVFNHELGNSLGPIASLARPSLSLLERADAGDKLRSSLEIIGERAAHLSEFLQSYAEFARLPQPRREPVSWGKFLDGLGHVIGFRPQVLSPPEAPGYFDPVQLQQVSSISARTRAMPEARRATSRSPFPPTTIAFASTCWIAAAAFQRLRSSGWPCPSARPNAPARDWVLPLCREILEAHGGGIAVANRPGGGAIVTCAIGHAPADSSPPDHERTGRSLDS